MWGRTLTQEMMVGKEVLLIVSEGCPGCEEAKRLLGENARVMDIAKSDDAAKIALELGIMAVPTLVMYDKEEGKMCLVDKKLLPTRCTSLSIGGHR